MEYYSTHINKLIEQLSHLPGIGPKSAQRLAFHIMNMPKDQVEQLTSSITGAREKIRYCKKCCTLTDQELCPICSNPKRDASTIMVVENTRDLAAYEKTGKYEGVYHVLHGAISPMLGIGPDDIKLKELMKRLQEDVREVIIATNSSLGHSAFPRLSAPHSCSRENKLEASSSSHPCLPSGKVLPAGSLRNRQRR